MAIKQALDQLRELEDGKLLDDMSIEFNELVRQVKKCNKVGSISLTIKINPVNGDTHNVTTEATLKVNSPQLARRQTLFFTTPECNLSRTDPSQRSFPELEDVSSDRQQTVELTDEKPTVNEA